VLDVKHGSGAFLAKTEDAISLAQTMIRVGDERGCPTVALLTAMDRPLGWACGNALETREAIAALRGEGPGDLMEVVYALGAEMLLLAGAAANRSDAQSRLRAVIERGDAAERFRAVVEAQGGDPRVLDDPGRLPRAPVAGAYEAPRDGHVAGVNPRPIGRLIGRLGGGRRTMDDAIDLAVGVVVHVKPGDRVEAGQRLATIHARTEGDLFEARRRFAECIVVGPELGESSLPLISHRVTRVGVEPLTA
jgi:pyrimidine-nucleoside phosphorylase